MRARYCYGQKSRPAIDAQEVLTLFFTKRRVHANRVAPLPDVICVLWAKSADEGHCDAKGRVFTLYRCQSTIATSFLHAASMQRIYLVTPALKLPVEYRIASKEKGHGQQERKFVNRSVSQIGKSAVFRGLDSWVVCSQSLTIVAGSRTAQDPVPGANRSRRKAKLRTRVSSKPLFLNTFFLTHTYLPRTAA